MPCHFCHQFTERRVIYNFEKYGDSPACVGKDRNIKNQIALTQGFGLTENTKDLLEERPLLETNVTIISNDECYKSFSKYFNLPEGTTRKESDLYKRTQNQRTSITSVTYNGLTEGEMCAISTCDDTVNAGTKCVS